MGGWFDCGSDGGFRGGIRGLIVGWKGVGRGWERTNDLLDTEVGELVQA